MLSYYSDYFESLGTGDIDSQFLITRFGAIDSLALLLLDILKHREIKISTSFTRSTSED